MSHQRPSMMQGAKRFFAALVLMQQPPRGDSTHDRASPPEAFAPASAAYLNHLYGWRPGDLRVRPQVGDKNLDVEVRTQQAWTFSLHKHGGRGHCAPGSTSKQIVALCSGARCASWTSSPGTTISVLLASQSTTELLRSPGRCKSAGGDHKSHVPSTEETSTGPHAAERALCWDARGPSPPTAFPC